ncbi:cell wall protein [Vagococcus sp. BWB3-3]|uniref:Cell wall protein n=1 Tax=Vagococcus allomyrinae TaxID=2794353 RepID=A0A940P8V8_9ENTE|nr:cell wall protein [Vagococcus allomyrinae]MBP1040240.1 cell wall protein [Vagococcus allomyrinae]
MRKKQAWQQAGRLLLGLVIMGSVLFGKAALIEASTLPSGLVIADDSGIVVSKEGDYFVDMPNVLPGDVYTKDITIRSTDEKEPFDIGLRVKKISSTGDIDFNKHVTVSLVLEGKEIYKGPLLGNGEFDWTKESLPLGTYQFGTDRVLKATFTVDKALTAESYKLESEMKYEWKFIAMRDDQPIVDPKPDPPGKKPFIKLPQTGEEWRNLIYKVLVGFLLILIALLLWKQKRRENEHRE